MASDRSSDRPQILQAWYEALHRGDFPALQELLVDHPSLSKLGWDSDSSKTVKCLDADGKETLTKWKGSTALIAAASYGCVHLVEKTLQTLNAPTNSSTLPPVDGKGPALSTTEETKVESNQDESGAAIPSRADAVLEVDKSEQGEHVEVPQKGASADAGIVAKIRNTVWTHPKAQFERALTKARPPVDARSGNETDEHGGEISDKFRDLLVSESGWWKMNAITIAVICGSDEVLGLLVHAMGTRKEPLPYGIKPHSISQRQGSTYSSDRDRLSEVTMEFFKTWPSREKCKALYAKDPHCNFLPMEQYLFHFLCQCHDADVKPAKVTLWKKIKLVNDLWRFVLNFQDAQGRPPFHVAIRSDETESFFQILNGESKNVIICAMTASDRAGRSPVHVAAALGRNAALQELLEYAKDLVEVSKTCTAKWQYEVPHSDDPIPIDIDELSKRNGFGYHHGPYTAVHAALLHRNFDCARLLIQSFPLEDWGTYKFTCATIKDVDVIVEFETMELACFMIADSSLIRLLKDAYLSKTLEYKVENQVYKHPWHAVHIVAASGNYENLKLFFNDSRCLLSTLEDFEGNSALHHALRVREYGFQTHLVDHFELERVLDDKRFIISSAEELLGSDQTEKRQGCIDLLLQGGCDVFTENQAKLVPYPGPALENNGKLATWWSEKQTKELQATETDCVNAANAISVTAALVATTSYVGPLQPPLSYGDNGIHENNVWVIIFMVCDTMSFYLAIAAITISLIPSLPATRQTLKKRPYTTRDMVTLSVVILFPAIIFVFMAFACSSLAVASANVTSTVAGQLTLATTVIGTVICLLAFILFTIRLLVFILPDNQLLMSFNDWTKLPLTKAKSKSKSQ